MRAGYITLALLIIATLVCLFAIVNLAFAHSWYDQQCCNMRDCEPIPFEAVTETNDSYIVTYVSGRGFPVHAVVPRAKARHSQDGRFHGCATSTRFLCLYVPSVS